MASIKSKTGIFLSSIYLLAIAYYFWYYLNCTNFVHITTCRSAVLVPYLPWIHLVNLGGEFSVAKYAYHFVAIGVINVFLFYAMGALIERLLGGAWKRLQLRIKSAMIASFFSFLFVAGQSLQDYAWDTFAFPRGGFFLNFGVGFAIAELMFKFLMYMTTAFVVGGFIGWILEKSLYKSRDSVL